MPNDLDALIDPSNGNFSVVHRWLSSINSETHANICSPRQIKGSHLAIRLPNILVCTAIRDLEGEKGSPVSSSPFVRIKTYLHCDEEFRRRFQYLFIGIFSKVAFLMVECCWAFLSFLKTGWFSQQDTTVQAICPRWIGSSVEASSSSLRVTITVTLEPADAVIPFAHQKNSSRGSSILIKMSLSYLCWQTSSKC